VRENLESGGFGLKGGETTLKASDCEKKEEYFHPRTLLQKRNSQVKLNFMKKKKKKKKKKKNKKKLKKKKKKKKSACERNGKNLLMEVAIGREERRVLC